MVTPAAFDSKMLWEAQIIPVHLPQSLDLLTRVKQAKRHLLTQTKTVSWSPAYFHSTEGASTHGGLVVPDIYNCYLTYHTRFLLSWARTVNPITVSLAAGYGMNMQSCLNITIFL